MAQPVFSVLRAEVADGTHVKVFFTCPLESSSVNENPANFVFSGTHDLVARSCSGRGNDYIEVEVNEMQPNTSYTVTVQNVRDVFSRKVSSPRSYTFTGAGDSPYIVSATAINSRTLRIVFSEPMTNGLQLRNAANYTFTGDYDLVFPCDVVAQSVTVLSSKVVIIYTSSMFPKSGYFVHVRNVFDVYNNVIEPRLGNKNFASTFLPMIESAVCYSAERRVRISFDREMVRNAALLNPANYIFSGPSRFTGIRVVYVNWHTVDVYYQNAFSEEQYYITVVNATDLVGREPDPYSPNGYIVLQGNYEDPRVTNAAALAGTTVRVTFDHAMLNNAALTNTNNYVFSGTPTISAILVTRVSSTAVDITTTEMYTGGAYQVTVQNVIDVYYVGLDPLYKSATFTGLGVSPWLSSAATQDTTTIRLTFNEAMLNNAALTNIANYGIAGPTTLTASLITRINATTVDMQVAEEMRTGGSYTVTVNNVVDIVGNVIDPAHKSAVFVGLGVAPQLSSATVQDTDTIRLVFNEGMENNAALTNTANYVFAGPTSLTSSLVTRINATTVDVDIAEEMRTGGSYTVTVSNVVDLVGNVIDPAHDDAVFIGVGVAPQVSSAAFIDTTHCSITFDESMDATTTETVGNYSLSGPTAADVSNASLTGATVELTFDTELADGDYTVTVSNVTDLVGNVIDPAHDEGNFTAASGPLSDIVNHISLKADLLSYYKLEGNARDSWDTNDGTAEKAVVTVAGKILNCVSFDGAPAAQPAGTYQIVNLGSLIEGISSFSFSLWANINNTGGTSHILTQANQTGAGWDGEERLFFYHPTGASGTGTLEYVASGGSVTVTFPFTAAVWTHYVGTVAYNAGTGVTTVSLYKNGALANSNSGSVGDRKSSTRSLLVGGCGYTVTSRYDAANGKIDEVAFASRAWTSGEVTALYNAGYGLPLERQLGIEYHPTLRTNLVAWWTMDSDLQDSYSTHNGSFYTTGSPITFPISKLRTGVSMLGSPQGHYGAVPSSSDFNSTEFTLAGWVYIAAGVPTATIVERTDGTNRWTLCGSGAKLFWTASTSGVGLWSRTLVTNGWHHVVCYYKYVSAIEQYNSLWVDGVLATETGGSKPATWALTSGDVTFGKGSVGWWPQALGLDELAFWTRALTSDERADLYQSGIGVTYDSSYDSVSTHPTLLSGLLAYYEFEDTCDDSTGTYNGSPVGSPTYETGVTNKAIRLNGSSQYVNLGTSSNLTPNEISICAWVKRSAVGGVGDYPGIVTRRDAGDHSYSLIGVDGLRFSWYLRTTTGTPFVETAWADPTTTWKLIVSTYSKTTGLLALYVDGALANSATHAAKGTLVDKPAIEVHIGYLTGFATGYYPGWIDGAGIFSRELILSEAYNLFNYGNGLTWT